MKEVATRAAPRTTPHAQATFAAARVPLIALVLLVVPALLPPPAMASDARADATRGRQLLAHYQCGACHEIPGVRNARGRLGPSLARLGSRGYIAGEVPMNATTLQAWLVQPSALVPGTLMPAMGVTTTDAGAMAAYLLSLR